MAKFCGKCGKPVQDGKILCEQCAAQKNDSVPQSSIQIIRETPDLKSMNKDRKKHKIRFVMLIVGILLIAAFLTVGAVMAINGISNKGEKEAVTDEYSKYEKIYKKILDDIISQSDVEGHEYINSLSRSLSDIAYTVRDVDGNGIKELLVYEVSESKNLIYEVYTIVNGKAVNLLKSGEDTKIYLTEDGGFLEVWESSQTEWGEDRYYFDDEGEGIEFFDRIVYDRDYAEGYFSDPEISDSECYFYTNTTDKKISYISITQEEAEEKRAENEKKKADINDGTTLGDFETDAKPPEKKLEVQAKDEEAVPEEYKAVIQAYIDAFPWEDGYPMINDMELSPLHNYLDGIDEAGCAIVDVNNDGVKELLIGSSGSNNQIYDMFTISEGGVHHILSQGMTTFWYYCDNGTLLNCILGSPYENYVRYTLEGAELSLFERYDRSYNASKEADDYTYEDASGEVTEITEEEFRMETDALESTYVTIDYVPISLVSQFE